MASRSISLPFGLPGARRSPARAVPRRLRMRPPGVRLLAAVVLTLMAAGGGWWWLRDSSVAGVRTVSITGLSGPQGPAIRTALTTAAHEMTTLHVRVSTLRTAVQGYPVIKAVRATGDFPHKLRITVVQRRPVAVLRVGLERVPVARDGTLLRGIASHGVATIALSSPAVGLRLRDSLALAQVRIVAGAPPALARRVTRVFTGGRGLQLSLRNGPVVAFGAPRRLAAKWAALAAVLADPASAGATVIDLSVPDRPAAVGLDLTGPVGPAAGPAAETPSPSGP